jgi:hypothetical protein
LEEDLVDRTAEEEPIMVDRACAEENIFFSLCCRTQKKEARVENMMLFSSSSSSSSRESFSARVSIKPKKESRERFFTLQKLLFCALSPQKRPHVLFVFSAFFHEMFVLFLRICPFLAPNAKKIQKKRSTLFSVLLLTHLCTNRRARKFTTTNYYYKQTLSLLLGK